MQKVKRVRVTRHLGILLAATVAATALPGAGARLWAQPAGAPTVALTIITPPAPPDKLRNVWPEEWERGFQARAQATIRTFAPKVQGGKYGGTYFENEKRAYPYAMLDFLAGNRESALKFLQAEDANAREWNAHTEGIDFFPSFTLKGQVRKYFLLGELLDPIYKQRMQRGAKLWTEQDPLRRPHPNYQGLKGEGWTPFYKNSWVDVRNTDNLRAMRETAVYLFAEETGNEATRQLYKDRIRQFVRGLYSVGLGEWDSENYFGHTATSYVNLYDFAKDAEVKALAKAALDWFCTAAALKYFHGGWVGPNKRDYGGANRVYGSLAARTFDLYFDDCPLPNPDPEPDQLHLITSHYRPPQAVVALAHKQFGAPVELFSCKPSYDNWSSGGEQRPQYWETMFFGQTFQMGSVVSADAVSDVGPFKLGAFNAQRGVDFFVANSQPVVGHQAKNAKDQIGQLRNLLIWLRPADDKPFYFLVPRNAKLEKENGIWFWRFEKTWLALRPINLGEPADEPITMEKKEKNKPVEIVPDERFKDDRMLKTAAMGDTYSGFALEVGEAPQSYDDFKRAVKEKGRLDLALLPQGVAALTGSDGHTLRLEHNKNDDLPLVYRDGQQRDWNQQIAVYAAGSPADSKGKAPVAQAWGGGTLRVEAGGHTFEGRLSPTGQYAFTS